MTLVTDWSQVVSWVMLPAADQPAGLTPPDVCWGLVVDLPALTLPATATDQGFTMVDPFNRTGNSLYPAVFFPTHADWSAFFAALPPTSSGGGYGSAAWNAAFAAHLVEAGTIWPNMAPYNRIAAIGGKTGAIVGALFDVIGPSPADVTFAHSYDLPAARPASVTPGSIAAGEHTGGLLPALPVL